MITNGNQMTGRVRKAAATAVLALLALATLTGCIKLDMDVTVNRDDTVSGTLVIAFDKAVRERLGGSSDPLGGAPVKGVTSQKPYDDGTYEGVEYTFDRTPLADFNDADTESGDYLRIRHDGNEYVLDGVADESYDVPTAGGGPLDPAIVEALSKSDMRIKVTFPGTVLTTNGTVGDNGKSVTWQLRMGEKNTLHAVAGPGGNPELAMWVLWISLAAVVLVALLLFVRLRTVSLRG